MQNAGKMPSRFPGMNPFLEQQEWEDFHARLMTAISDSLTLRLDSNYFVRVERRVYVEHPGGEPETMRRADIAIVSVESVSSPDLIPQPGGTTTVDCELPMPVERRETFLSIRDRETMQVVTVIELLSPSNKRKNGDGRREYLTKRGEILASASHLVELDLLRGGVRLPVVGSLPPGDYYAIVSRANRRPRCEVYVWTLRHPLPAIRIPLKLRDPDATVPLQEVFETVCQRARYDMSVNYAVELQPPLSDAEHQWLQQFVG